MNSDQTRWRSQGGGKDRFSRLTEVPVEGLALSDDYYEDSAYVDYRHHQEYMSKSWPDSSDAKRLQLFYEYVRLSAIILSFDDQ